MFLNDYELMYLDAYSDTFVHDEAMGRLYIKGSTNTLDVYIAGIGMNHKVFISSFSMLSKLKLAKNWLFTLTLSGFNQYVQNNSQGNSGSPFLESEQIRNASLAIVAFMKKNKLKNVNLFGFSYGADLLCGIAKKLIDAKINVQKMVFSDINLSKETAFLTGKITEIENSNPSLSINEKKLAFMKLVLERSEGDDNIILDNLEYLRASYKVNWNQMVESSKSAYENSPRRITEIIDFLRSNNEIQTMFIVSNRVINGEENGYLKGISRKIDTIRINFSKPEYIPTSKHFDGISYIFLKKVNNFFKTT